MTALATVTRAPVAVNRRAIAAGTFIAFGLIDIFLFGFFAHKGDATFLLSVPGASISVPAIHAAAAQVAYVLGAVSIALGVLRIVADVPVRVKRVSIGVVLIFFVISLLCWAYAGSAIPLNAVNLLQSTLSLSVPLVLGALAGCMCERSGVINIAIEGQLLLGAFAAAVDRDVDDAGPWRCSRSATWSTRSSSASCSTCWPPGSPAISTTVY